MPGGTAFGGSTSPTLLFTHSVTGTLTPPLAGTVDPGCDTFPAPQKCLITARIAGDVWSIPWYLCRVATAVSNGAGFPAEANHEGLRWYCKPRAKPESLYFYKPRDLALGFMTKNMYEFFRLRDLHASMRQICISTTLHKYVRFLSKLRFSAHKRCYLLYDAHFYAHKYAAASCANMS